MFNDKDKLLLLNSITHPNVINYVKEAIENNKDKTILIESALLFDCELKDLCDKTIFVSTNLEKRIQWMRENRNYSEEKIQSILSKQKNDESLSDVIIENNGTLEELREKCMIILK